MNLSRSILATLIFVAINCFVVGQVQDDEIVISEFFNDLLIVSPGSADSLFEISRNDNITHLTIASPEVAYVSNFLEIWRIDLLDNRVTTLVDLGAGYTAPSEITMGTDGNLIIATATHGIQRVDAESGDVSDIFDDTFFNPSDVVATESGDLFVTEFFDGLGRIDVDGGWQKIGDFSSNFFSHLDIGPDGFLYAATTFEEGDIYRIHPVTGDADKIADNVYTFIDDLQVANDGLIYLAGATDVDFDNLVESTVLQIDPVDGNSTSFVDEREVGRPRPPFFNPMDIEIFQVDGGFYLADPEKIGVLEGDFNGNGILEVEDLELLNTQIALMANPPLFDLDGDGNVDQADHFYWIKELLQTWIGDANLDGEFNSADLVVVFQASEFEDDVIGNSTWRTGDFNGDQEFDSSDFVWAFQDGGFEQGPRPLAVPEPSSVAFLLLAFVLGARNCFEPNCELRN